MERDVWSVLSENTTRFNIYFHFLIDVVLFLRTPLEDIEYKQFLKFDNSRLFGNSGVFALITWDASSYISFKFGRPNFGKKSKVLVKASHVTRVAIPLVNPSFPLPFVVSIHLT